MPYRVTLIPGDGIGPELAEATRRVLDASGVAFAGSLRNRTAAARAWVGVRATSQGGTGSPWATRSDFASASWIFTRRA